MKHITHQEDYGIYLMNTLSDNYGKGPLSLNTVANQSGLSVFFLKQLAGRLKRAGLIKSKEGIGGGYALSKHPSKITLGMIVEAFSGPLSFVDCCGKAKNGNCKIESVCKVKSTLGTIHTELSARLNSLTLSSI